MPCTVSDCATPQRSSAALRAGAEPDAGPGKAMTDRGAQLAAAQALAADTARCEAGFGALIARADIPARAVEELRRRLAEPHRAHYGTAHLGLLWLRHLMHGGDAGDRNLALAILFHHAVHDPMAQDNASRSAALLAALVPGETGWAQAAIRATADIGATAEHAGAAGRDGRMLWLLDLLLTPLAERPDIYQRNTALIRRACAQQPEAEWREGRRRQLARLIAARPLFRTRLGTIYEAAARENLAAELAALRAAG